MNDPEVNKLSFNDQPLYVQKAVDEEHQRFRKELLTFGPKVVSMDTLKPRQREAAAEAKRLHEQENPQNG